MLLKDRFAAHGTFLFRWRSFLPLIFLVPALIALPQSGHMEALFGDAVEDVWTALSVGIAFAGLAVRIATVGFAPAGTSGRNTQGQRAERLNTTGLYSVVRNPLYLGNAITLLGFVLAIKVWWLPLIVIPCAYFYYERIVYAEERFLQKTFGAEYETWASKTPAFIPRFRNRRRPDLPFSLRSVLRREYHGFFLIVAVMFLIEAGSDLIGEGEPFQEWIFDDYGWTVFFAASLVAYAVIRTIRKTTSWLAVPGR